MRLNERVQHGLMGDQVVCFPPLKNLLEPFFLGTSFLTSAPLREEDPDRR